MTTTTHTDAHDPEQVAHEAELAQLRAESTAWQARQAVKLKAIRRQAFWGTWGLPLSVLALLVTVKVAFLAAMPWLTAPTDTSDRALYQRTLDQCIADGKAAKAAGRELPIGRIEVCNEVSDLLKATEGAKP